jgi:hypothetical protein
MVSQIQQLHTILLFDPSIHPLLPRWLIPAAYAIVVRSSEYDLSPEMLDDIVAKSISSYSGQTFGRRREADNSDDDDERV